MKSLLALLPAIAFLVLAGTARAERLTPCDDMYSDPNHGGLPNTETELWTATFSGAGHYERIMIKFDQSALCEAAGRSASSAVLNLYRFFGCPSHPYTATDIYAGTVDWDEVTWPVTTHLPHEADPVASCIFGPDNGWASADITDLVNSWLSGERPNCGLVIQAREGEKWSKFYSKDHPTESLRPYLDLEWETAAPDLVAASFSCAPNPFNPTTTLSFMMDHDDDVRLRVYDARGRFVDELAAGRRGAGNHRVRWDGHDRDGRVMPAGCYIATLEIGRARTQIKLDLVK